jgi:CDP-diacylglycerol--glycerol-3-phosphate 3-phosphatidyltransferase
MTSEQQRKDARIRDMPAPRDNSSVTGRFFPKVLAWPYRIIITGMYKVGLRAWHVTIASLVLNIAAGALLLTGRRLVPGFLLIFGGLLDVFDGGVARLRGEESRFGAFLDSTLDRVADLILFGCLFWSLAGEHLSLSAALALITLVVSLGVSHVRAEGEAEGIKLSEGFFQRLERYVALFFGLVIPGLLLPVLVLLAALGGLTLVQRISSAAGSFRELAQRPGAA